jgi:glycosyltransferase involved in cell wall biosynthesis
MRVWLLHIGEHLPIDGTSRLLRYGSLARALEDRGHQVLRWAPTFHHATKTFRATSDRRIQVSDSHSIQLVHAPGYRRNVSLSRLRSYRVLGQRFRTLARQEARPDVIVAAIPSLDWAQAAVEFGKARNIPVVIDTVDVWPDVFANAFPPALRSLGRFALAPYFRMARQACREATALTAVSPSYLDWALRQARRSRRESDLVLPLGFEPTGSAESSRQLHLAELRHRGIDPARPICMFAGLFERSYDLETVIDAAKRLGQTDSPAVQFVLCGDGGKMDTIRRRAQGLSNVHLLGWVDADMLQVVGSIAQIGLCAYTPSAMQSLPYKPFEYMAARLAIASSLPGELDQLVESEACGMVYRAGDANSLARCIRDLLDQPERLESMRNNSYHAWHTKFRSRDIYSRFVDHIANVASLPAQAA